MIEFCLKIIFFVFLLVIGVIIAEYLLFFVGGWTGVIAWIVYLIVYLPAVVYQIFLKKD